MDLAVLATVFGLIFLAELPDKTTIAGLVLGTRYPWQWVFAGVASAFLVHVCLAVSVGSLLTLLPERTVKAVVAVLFLVGAVLIWREGQEDVEDEVHEEERALADPGDAKAVKVASLAFGVIFAA